MKTKHLLLAALFNSATFAAAPATACDIVGTWTGPLTFIGSMASRGTINLTLSVKEDCTYQFTLPGVVDTPGKATSEGKNRYEYRNPTGSIGALEIDSDGVMTMVQRQGTYTAKLRKK
jgi:hypothetical protein